jgi:hypothetical protein
MGEKRILHGRYALPADFKAGGMARVYRAADLDDESRIVAVKVLNTSSDERTTAIAFERETKALMRLSHLNIVELLEAGRRYRRRLGATPTLAYRLSRRARGAFLLRRAGTSRGYAANSGDSATSDQK